MDADNPKSLALAYALKRRSKKMAMGGMTHMADAEDEYDPAEHPAPKHNMAAMEEDEHEDDMIGDIMKERAKCYSKGGMAANDTPVVADFEDNDFDELANRDDLEEHYTGANSGDEIGNEHLNHEDHDMVSEIMRSRRKKDRLPRTL